MIVTDDHDRCAVASVNDGHRSRSYLGGQIWIVVDNKTMRKNAWYDCHLLHYIAPGGNWLCTRCQRSANTLPGKYGLQQTIQCQQQRMLDSVFIPRTQPAIAGMRLLQSKPTRTDVLTFYLQLSVAVLRPTAGGTKNRPTTSEDLN